LAEIERDSGARFDASATDGVLTVDDNLAEAGWDGFVPPGDLAGHFGSDGLRTTYVDSGYYDPCPTCFDVDGGLLPPCPTWGQSCDLHGADPLSDLWAFREPYTGVTACVGGQWTLLMTDTISPMSGQYVYITLTDLPATATVHWCM